VERGDAVDMSSVIGRRVQYEESAAAFVTRMNVLATEHCELTLTDPQR
jgi:hypothetical protein